MPYQNRVDPWGQVIRTAARGTLMGNRGILHNEKREIVKSHVDRRWIACVLEFQDRRREVMAPHSYTHLFFLDEATALAAGHRPCAECRREHYRAFQSAWGGKPSADTMDRALHQARMRDGAKVTFQAEAATLPDGCFIERNGGACRIAQGSLRLWSPEGYGAPEPIPDAILTVLTPAPIVTCLRNGYKL